MANLKRYCMVVRRDENGYASPALKVRKEGEVVKFEDLEEFLRTSHNSDYAATLRVIRELRASNSNACYTVDLEQWCKLHLNA